MVFFLFLRANTLCVEGEWDLKVQSRAPSGKSETYNTILSTLPRWNQFKKKYLRKLFLQTNLVYTDDSPELYVEDNFFSQSNT